MCLLGTGDRIPVRTYVLCNLSNDLYSPLFQGRYLRFTRIGAQGIVVEIEIRECGEAGQGRNVTDLVVLEIEVPECGEAGQG